MSLNERSRTVAELSARVAENLGLPRAGGIPPENQIVGLVDAYVAMTARMPNDDALWALWRLAGERYAPKLVDALIEVAARPYSA
jgi:HD-GYP domain-containing protein (c-di-GMP phosphodiesterase class II)